MAGFTTWAFRQMLRRCGGVGLPFTEMISARGFARLDRQAALPDRLDGIADEPRPLGVQIWDNAPELLARIGRTLVEQHRVSVIDINFGCPAARIAQKARSGSYLLGDPLHVGRIVQHVVDACAPTPVTAKVRLGPCQDRITVLEVARAVESAGAAALIVHGRTAADFFRGRADWTWIARVKDAVHRMPIIGNGDLRSGQDAVRAWHSSGVDGLMVGRALLHRPWLGRQMAAAMAGAPIPDAPKPDEQRRMVLEHFDLVLQQFGAEKGTMLMRKFACCYAKGHPGARRFRAQVATVRSPDQLRQVVRDWFPSTT